MDGFPPMPAEIVRLISIEAVRVRGAKRAVRLRLVNRSWNREVMEALFESGISDSFGSLGPVFWPKHLMHKLRQRENLLSRPLRLIRRAAQHVVAFRSGEPNYENHDAVQEYLWEICQLSEDCNVLGPCWPSIFEVPEQMDPIQDSDEDFKQTLLAAAAATNDLALVRELLPLMQGCVHLIYGRDRQESVQLRPRM
ncbi:NACHT and ankyrin domain-containing protein [Colletotrichum tofieldiae]|nr:NACHT and ankyrin domain-containing protein [Colletotrichum tofieldiae]GKT79726.1 NACHT and ankyrin domain-containing protein [Colletotrichum tofieldiae]